MSSVKRFGCPGTRGGGVGVLFEAGIAVIDPLLSHPEGVQDRVLCLFDRQVQTAPVRVDDGDTLGVDGERVRLYGIDAPESGQTCERSGSPWQCGVAATEALASWLEGKATACVELDRDRYGQAVSTCSADGQDVGQWMVRQGWAVEYRQYSDGRYAQDEREAADRRVGFTPEHLFARQNGELPGNSRPESL